MLQSHNLESHGRIFTYEFPQEVGCNLHIFKRKAEYSKFNPIIGSHDLADQFRALRIHFAEESRRQKPPAKNMKKTIKNTMKDENGSIRPFSILLVGLEPTRF